MNSLASSAPAPPPRRKSALSQQNRRQREREAGVAHSVDDQSSVVLEHVDASAHDDPSTDDETSPTALPLARVPYREPCTVLSFGRMDIICRHCAAHHWLDERISDSSPSAPVFSHCCHNGKVVLEPLPNPPERLRLLFTARSREARQFREHIRRYNCALAFTSFTTKEKDNVPAGRGPWVWKCGYTIYHRVATLLPHAVDNPKYAQLYFYDPHDALDHRMKKNEELN